MTQVSRPLLVALAAAVLLLGVWVVALKPSSSGSGTAANPAPSAPGVKGLANAINKAHAAVAASNAASAAHGGTITPTSTLSTPSVTTSLSTTTPTTQAEASARERGQAAASSHPQPSARTSAPATGTPSTRLDRVSRALAARKVLAMLFYNPAAPDDQAVRQELHSIPALSGRVVKLAVPLSELSSYPVVTTQVPVYESPTLVIVNPAKQATTIVGFSDTLEIAQRITDAFA